MNAKKKLLLTKTSIFKISSFILLLCVTYLSYHQYTVINNADFYRVASSLHIKVPSWTEIYPDIYFPEPMDRYTSFFRVPDTTYGFITYFVRNYNLIFDIDYVSLSTIKCVLYLIFITGTYLLIFQRKTNLPVVLSFIVSLPYLYILNSLYLEATVFAFMPWLVWSVNSKKSFLFVLFSLLVVISKAQMIFILPFSVLILVLKEQHKIRRILWSALLIIPSLYFVTKQSKEHSQPNTYHRLYNTIGYTVMDVENWNENTFKKRYAYFYKNQDSLQKNHKTINITEKINLLGTSFWPTGQETLKHYTAQQLHINNNNFFFSQLFYNPILILKIVKSSFLTASKADYSLEYLVKSNTNSSFVIVSKNITSIAYIIFITVLLIGNFIKFNNYKITYTICIIFGVPFFTVVGDGYFEFEKHILPYIFLLPFFIQSLFFLDLKSENIEIKNK